MLYFVPKIIETNLGSYIKGDSKIPSTVRFMGNSVIGNNCKLGEYIMLDNCIVLDNAEVPMGTELCNCIIMPASIELQNHRAKVQDKNIITV